MNTDRRALILDAIREGAWPIVAARSVGYSRRQWDEILSSDAAFVLEVETAEAEAELALIRQVRPMEKGVGGVGFLLERRFPQRWSFSLRQKLEEERQELLAALKGNLDEVTFRRVALALQDHVAKAKKTG